MPRKKNNRRKKKGGNPPTMPKYPGELHPPLITPEGLRRGNYLGPRTHIVDRIKRGDRPINFADKEAQAHDIRYSLAGDKEAVRRADLKMINKMNEGLARKLDSPLNLKVGKYGIMTKVGLEKLGIAKPTTFTTFGSATEEDKKILEPKLKQLESEGFGKKKKKRVTVTHMESPYIIHQL